jgi:Leucine Rich repeat
VVEPSGLRSPKRLADLATDALCRSLPMLNGELPPGLPQDVVDCIVSSLVSHSALNATTLRIFKHCELNSLSLAGCRGVSDAWIEALVTRPLSLAIQDSEMEGLESIRSNGLRRDVENNIECDDLSGCSTTSFVSAASQHHPCDDDDDEEEEEEDHAMEDLATLLPSPPYHNPSMLFLGDAGRTDFEVPATFTSSLTLLDLRGSSNLTDRGLLQLCNLTQLEVAKLDNCHGLVGYGLLALSSSHRLQTLSLANCRRLTDEAVISISHLTSIQALSLDGCRCLTNRSMTALAELKALRKLGLSQCDFITDAGLEPLASLDLLEELSLGWCRQVSDRGIDLLTQHPGRAANLTILRLARVPVTDVGVGHLARLTALEELDLSGCTSIGSIALGKTLQRLLRLSVLDVSYCPGIL